ncbi:MAG TPA: sugar phosphate isomerase/epimerase [Amycolatopsis sp.]|nr:sugar phosphate isomerase/epimerase [Amycolatopsis sp.]
MTLPAANFEDRVVAAAAAGLDAVGYHHKHYRRDVRAGATDAELVAIAAANGIQVTEVEAVHGVLEQDSRRKVVDFFDRVLTLGALFGARHMIVHSEFDGNNELAADRFGRLCDRAAPYDIRVGLEFVPWTTLPDLATALRVVRAAGRVNGGVVLDAWHFFRGRADIDEVTSLRPGELVAVQLTDGLPRPGMDPMVETLTMRREPGRGTFPLDRLVTALSHHPDVQWSIEVIYPELDALAPATAAGQVADACRRLLGSESESGPRRGQGPYRP